MTEVIMQDLRKSPAYQRWRREVKQRDKNTCRVCGVQRNLHVHHIKPLEKYPEFATELDNGITLCGNCHTFLSGKEENTNLKTMIEAVTGQHDMRTAEQLKDLNDKFCKYLKSHFSPFATTINSPIINNAVYKLFTHLQTYPDSLNQFLPLIEHILDENENYESFAKQLAIEFLKGSTSPPALKVLSKVEAKQNIATKWRVSVWDLGQGFDIRSVTILNLSSSRPHVIIALGINFDTVRLWSIKIGREYFGSPIAPIASFSAGYNKYVRSVAYDPLYGIIAAGHNDGKVTLRLIKTGKEILTLSGDGSVVRCVAYSRNENMIAAGFSSGIIKLWSVKLWSEQIAQKLATFSEHESGFDGISSVAFSTEGDLIAAGTSDGTVQLWSIETGQELATFAGHEGYVTSVAFSPRGDLIASGSNDGTVKLWSIEDVQELTTIEIDRDDDFGLCLTYSSGGDMVAVGFREGIKLWSVETGQELATFKTKNQVLSITSSEWDNKIAVGLMDGSCELWDISSFRK
jgi:WD40 repeat protein